MIDMPDEFNTNDLPISTPQQQLLRLTIKEAVEREVTAQMAAYKQQVQIIVGKVTQFDRDFGSLSTRIDKLDNVVLGNEALGIPGLRNEMRGISTKMDALLDQKEALLNQITGVKYVLGVLGAVGGLVAIPQIPVIIRFFGSMFP